MKNDFSRQTEGAGALTPDYRTDTTTKEMLPAVNKALMDANIDVLGTAILTLRDATDIKTEWLSLIEEPIHLLLLMCAQGEIRITYRFQADSIIKELKRKLLKKLKALSGTFPQSYKKQDILHIALDLLSKTDEGIILALLNKMDNIDLTSKGKNNPLHSVFVLCAGKFREQTTKLLFNKRHRGLTRIEGTLVAPYPRKDTEGHSPDYILTKLTNTWHLPVDMSEEQLKWIAYENLNDRVIAEITYFLLNSVGISTAINEQHLENIKKSAGGNKSVLLNAIFKYHDDPLLLKLLIQAFSEEEFSRYFPETARNNALIEDSLKACLTLPSEDTELKIRIFSRVLKSTDKVALAVSTKRVLEIAHTSGPVLFLKIVSRNRALPSVDKAAKELDELALERHHRTQNKEAGAGAGAGAEIEDEGTLGATESKAETTNLAELFAELRKGIDEKENITIAIIDLKKFTLENLKTIRSIVNFLETDRPVIPNELSSGELLFIVLCLAAYYAECQEIGSNEETCKTFNDYYRPENLLKHIQIIMDKYKEEEDTVDSLEQKKDAAMLLTIMMSCVKLIMRRKSPAEYDLYGIFRTVNAIKKALGTSVDKDYRFYYEELTYLVSQRATKDKTPLSEALAQADFDELSSQASENPNSLLRAADSAHNVTDMLLLLCILKTHSNESTKTHADQLKAKLLHKLKTEIVTFPQRLRGKDIFQIALYYLDETDEDLILTMISLMEVIFLRDEPIIVKKTKEGTNAYTLCMEKFSAVATEAVIPKLLNITKQQDAPEIILYLLSVTPENKHHIIEDAILQTKDAICLDTFLTNTKLSESAPKQESAEYTAFSEEMETYNEILLPDAKFRTYLAFLKWQKNLENELCKSDGAKRPKQKREHQGKNSAAGAGTSAAAGAGAPTKGKKSKKKKSKPLDKKVKSKLEGPFKQAINQYIQKHDITTLTEETLPRDLTKNLQIALNKAKREHISIKPLQKTQLSQENVKQFILNLWNEALSKHATKKIKPSPSTELSEEKALVQFSLKIMRHLSDNSEEIAANSETGSIKSLFNEFFTGAKLLAKKQCSSLSDETLDKIIHEAITEIIKVRGNARKTLTKEDKLALQQRYQTMGASTHPQTAFFSDHSVAPDPSDLPKNPKSLFETTYSSSPDPSALPDPEPKLLEGLKM